MSADAPEGARDKAPIHSNVPPPLDAAGDRHHPRQECSQDRDDHTQFNFIRL
jgi:hypothetical protein